jgi:hypothetical protein
VRRQYLGRYAFGPGGAQVVEVGERDERLTLRVGEGSPRFLVQVSPHAFHPVGAAAVRIVFAVEGPAVTRMTIRDGALVVAAERVG